MAPAPIRLRRRAQFLRVAKLGRKIPTPGVVLQVLQRDDAEAAAIGFTVTKKIGNAVMRNRTRRRLKEATRLWLRDHPVTGVDLVMVGREGTRARKFDLLIQDVRLSLAKAGVQ